MMKEVEIRFATKTYEYINVKFDKYPTDEEYKEAKAMAEYHKNFILKKCDPLDELPEIDINRKE